MLIEIRYTPSRLGFRLFKLAELLMSLRTMLKVCDRFPITTSQHSPLYEREEIWGESDLAMACGTVTDDKTKDEKSYSPR